MSAIHGNSLEELRNLPLRPSGAQPLEVRIMRAGLLESIHHVHAVICDPRGGMEHHWGDFRRQVFPRSAVKLMQALPFFWNESHLKYNLSNQELAVACASHHGEDRHVQLVESWLHRMNLSQEDLECGAHFPYDEKSTHRLIRSSCQPGCLHNNCSGKHAGMLMGCLASHEKTQNYSSYHHPWQKKIRDSFARFFDTSMDAVNWGVDGCGVPTYHLPLFMLAKGIARLAQGDGLDLSSSSAVKQMNQALISDPFFIGGTESICSKILVESKGLAIAKVGAEGVYAAWFPKLNLGLVLKCEDGAARGSEIAMLKILEHLKVPLGDLKSVRSIQSWNKEIVGSAYCA